MQDLVHLPCLRLWHQQLDRVVAANLEKDAAAFKDRDMHAGEPQPSPTFLGRQALDVPSSYLLESDARCGGWILSLLRFDQGFTYVLHGWLKIISSINNLSCLPVCLYDMMPAGWLGNC